MEPLIKDISDTARWVAIFRAEESERPDAVFHDPFARRLAGKKGELIANAIEFSRINSWSFVARTYLVDEFINQHISLGFDMIVNLAAGLDARPFRMQLPSSLNWIEVDLPSIINYKESILGNEKPNCNLERIQLDLSDRDSRVELFKELGKRSVKSLIISEGLIIYLSNEEVASLSIDLSMQNTFWRWVFDLASPAVLTMAQEEMGPALKEANAIFQFAPEEGEEFFIPYSWKPLESKSSIKTAASLNRLSGDMLSFASLPEPEGPRRPFPWSGVCLLENIKKG